MEGPSTFFLKPSVVYKCYLWLFCIVWVVEGLIPECRTLRSLEASAQTVPERLGCPAAARAGHQGNES